MNEQTAAEAFKALGHPARLKILRFIADCCEPGCCETDRAAVGRMAELVGLSQPSVSHHLKELRRAGLVDVRRLGRGIECRINVEVFGDLWKSVVSTMEVSEEGRK